MQLCHGCHRARFTQIEGDAAGVDIRVIRGAPVLQGPGCSSCMYSSTRDAAAGRHLDCWPLPLRKYAAQLQQILPMHWRCTHYSFLTLQVARQRLGNVVVDHVPWPVQLVERVDLFIGELALRAP